ncbi:universal stress protein [Prosthecochloris sp. CIB 2401]|uniref:universal stress protein n=1 Tax=Prosthecochloris sp. CIB 2401 TaxID=1868325 RepID=UPI00080A964D|nr:universal stress protein [Prosthecochloris sp. CIB 2401]ANT65892.1 Stress response protein NhaX [Prosthecochloris sp. CIB 2401]
MKILCAIDFSLASASLLEAAARLAGECHAELGLLHVLPPEGTEIDLHPSLGDRFNPPPKYYKVPGTAEKGQNVLLFHDKRQQMLEAMVAWLQERQVTATFTVIHEVGDMVGSMLEHSEKTQADIIMLGAKRKAALQRMVTGSTCNEILKRSTKPVLIVPASSHKKDDDQEN